MSTESGYPRSDHFDGDRFFDPSGTVPPTFRALLRWKMSAAPTRWPSWIEDSFPPPLPAIQEGGIAATFIGHATWLLRLGSVTVLTDPIWSERCSPVTFAGPRRVRRPGLPFGALPRVDVAVVSHGHYDHLDLPTLQRIAELHRPTIVTPLGHRPVCARHAIGPVHEMDWWQSWEGPRGLRVELVPARHFTARGVFDRNRALWGGFVLERAGRRVYFAGDTGYGAHFGAIRDRLGPLDLALLPIGAYEPRWFMRPLHLDPEEAVRAHLDLGSPRTLAMHWGTFPLTDEGIEAPLGWLAAARTAAGISSDLFRIVHHGETILL